MFRFRDAYLFTWKLPSQPVELKKLLSYAVDSPEEFSEFSRVASLLDRYHRVHAMTRTLDLEFAELARERARRHPIRTYLWIPIERRSDVVHAADQAALLGPALAACGKLPPQSDGL